MTEKIILPNEFTLPEDLRNFGVKCLDCQSPRVVYQITVPAPGFDKGSYCYNCLLTRCRFSHRIPFPMETEMLDMLQGDLGLKGHKFYYAGRRRIPLLDPSKIGR